MKDAEVDFVANILVGVKDDDLAPVIEAIKEVVHTLLKPNTPNELVNGAYVAITIEVASQLVASHADNIMQGFILSKNAEGMFHANIREQMIKKFMSSPEVTKASMMKVVKHL